MLKLTVLYFIGISSLKLFTEFVRFLTKLYSSFRSGIGHSDRSFYDVSFFENHPSMLLSSGRTDDKIYFLKTEGKGFFLVHVTISF